MILGALLLTAELYVPIAGRVVGADGREHKTALTLRSSRTNEVSITFLKAAGANPNPRPSLTLRLAPGERREVDPIGDQRALGALRIVASEDLEVDARVNTTGSASVSVPAIDARRAIGNGGFATLPSVERLYVVETRGASLSFIVNDRGFYAGPYEARTIDVGGAVRVRGLNGAGRIVFGGSRGGDDVIAMQNVHPRPRRISIAEIVAYAALVVLAILSGGPLPQRPRTAEGSGPPH